MESREQVNRRYWRVWWLLFGLDAVFLLAASAPIAVTIRKDGWGADMSWWLAAPFAVWWMWHAFSSQRVGDQPYIPAPDKN